MYLGPVSLAKFEPRVSADLAGFNKGAEAQLARYKTEAGEAKLLLLSYPTPQIAGERFREFAKRPEWKRGAMDRWWVSCWMPGPGRADKLLVGHLLSAERHLERKGSEE